MNWRCYQHGILVQKENHFFTKIEKYIATVVKPTIDKDTKNLFFPESDLKEIEIEILNVLNEQ